MSQLDQTTLSAPVSKVAQVTLAFWIMKVLATTLGETAGDFISMTLDMGYLAGLTITFGLLAIILLLQIAAQRLPPGPVLDRNHCDNHGRYRNL